MAVVVWSLALALLGSRRWYVPQVKLMVWIYRKEASGLLCDGRIRLLNEMLVNVVSQEQAERVTEPLSRFFTREVFRELVLAEQTGASRGRALPLP